MSNVKKLLEERNVENILAGVKDAKDFVKKQREIKKLLAEREYGEMPKKPDHLHVEEISMLENFACGRAVLKRLKFTVQIGENEFSFPVISAIPKSDKKLPAFVFLSFESGDANKYMPTEEIVERGFAIFSFCYKDVTSDDGDFKNGIAKYLTGSRRKNTAPGKIALWAWAAMRVMDYVEALADKIDLDNVAVIGHSRLGKTALLAGGHDERFRYVISNDSGCCGAALESGKVGERYERINEVFPFWFCPAFNRDAANGVQLPFDQHFLLALTVPRQLIIGSAKEDVWADPTSEFLATAALDGSYELFGKNGLVHNDEIPEPRTVLSEGSVCYYVREGTHFLSRHDWNTYMDIIKEKMQK